MYLQMVFYDNRYISRTIEDEILFYISLKNPTRIENSSALVEYVFLMVMK